jgi:uncharacterized protein
LPSSSAFENGDAAIPDSRWVLSLTRRAVRYPRPMDPHLLHLLVTREMPYGKYKGRVIADLPGNYLAWFAREGFPPGELGRLLALMLEIDHNGLKHLLAPLRRLSS